MNRLEQMIIMANKGCQLKEIGKQFNISRQRVLQIFNKNKFDYHSIVLRKKEDKLKDKLERRKRTCKTCGKVFFIDDNSGYSYCSKSCHIIRDNEYHKLHNRIYYKTDRGRKAQKKWISENKEKYNEYVRKYLKKKYWENVEESRRKGREHYRNYYAKNRKKVLLRQKERRKLKKLNQDAVL